MVKIINYLEESDLTKQQLSHCQTRNKLFTATFVRNKRKLSDCIELYSLDVKDIQISKLSAHSHKWDKLYHSHSLPRLKGHLGREVQDE